VPSPRSTPTRVRPADLTDIARIRQRRGVWARVTLDGDREGWIESRRLAPLALPGAAGPGAAMPERVGPDDRPR
jgi:hypothetical protein